jgi:hypothetical protein
MKTYKEFKESLTEEKAATWEVMDNGRPIRRKFASQKEAIAWAKMLGARSLIKVTRDGTPIGKNIWVKG